MNLIPGSMEDAAALLGQMDKNNSEDYELKVHFIISKEAVEAFLRGEKSKVQAVYIWDDESTIKEREDWMKENVWPTENPKILEEIAKHETRKD